MHFKVIKLPVDPQKKMALLVIRVLQRYIAMFIWFSNQNIITKLSIAQMVRFFVVKPTQGSSPRVTQVVAFL